MSDNTTKKQLEADEHSSRDLPIFTRWLRRDERMNKLYDWLNDADFVNSLRNTVIESERNCETRLLRFGRNGEHEAKVSSRWQRGLLSRKRWHSVRIHSKIEE